MKQYTKQLKAHTHFHFHYHFDLKTKDSINQQMVTRQFKSDLKKPPIKIATKGDLNNLFLPYFTFALDRPRTLSNSKYSREEKDFEIGIE